MNSVSSPSTPSPFADKPAPPAPQSNAPHTNQAPPVRGEPTTSADGTASSLIGGEVIAVTNTKRSQVSAQHQRTQSAEAPAVAQSATTQLSHLLSSMIEKRRLIGFEFIHLYETLFHAERQLAMARILIHSTQPLRTDYEFELLMLALRERSQAINTAEQSFERLKSTIERVEEDNRESQTSAEKRSDDEVLQQRTTVNLQLVDLTNLLTTMKEHLNFVQIAITNKIRATQTEQSTASSASAVSRKLSPILPALNTRTLQLIRLENALEKVKLWQVTKDIEKTFNEKEQLRMLLNAVNVLENLLKKTFHSSSLLQRKLDQLTHEESQREAKIAQTGIRNPTVLQISEHEIKLANGLCTLFESIDKTTIYLATEAFKVQEIIYSISTQPPMPSTSSATQAIAPSQAMPSTAMPSTTMPSTAMPSTAIPLTATSSAMSAPTTQPLSAQLPSLKTQTNRLAQLMSLQASIAQQVNECIYAAINRGDQEAQTRLTNIRQMSGDFLRQLKKLDEYMSRIQTEQKELVRLEQSGATDTLYGARIQNAYDQVLSIYRFVIKELDQLSENLNQLGSLIYENAINDPAKTAKDASTSSKESLPGPPRKKQRKTHLTAQEPMPSSSSSVQVPCAAHKKTVTDEQGIRATQDAALGSTLPSLTDTSAKLTQLNAQLINAEEQLFQGLNLCIAHQYKDTEQKLETIILKTLAKIVEQKEKAEQALKTLQNEIFEWIALSQIPETTHEATLSLNYQLIVILYNQLLSELDRLSISANALSIVASNELTQLLIITPTSPPAMASTNALPQVSHSSHLPSLTLPSLSPPTQTQPTPPQPSHSHRSSIRGQPSNQATIPSQLPEIQSVFFTQTNQVQLLNQKLTNSLMSMTDQDKRHHAQILGTATNYLKQINNQLQELANELRELKHSPPEEGEDADLSALARTVSLRLKQDSISSLIDALTTLLQQL